MPSSRGSSGGRVYNCLYPREGMECPRDHGNSGRSSLRGQMREPVDIIKGACASSSCYDASHWKPGSITAWASAPRSRPMDSQRFDALIRALITGSRRSFLGTLSAVAVGVLAPLSDPSDARARRRKNGGKKHKRCSSTSHLCKDLDGGEFCCSNSSRCCPGPGGDPADGLTGTCCPDRPGLRCCPDGACIGVEFPCDV
jgi:hypothetical protein